MGDFDAEKEGTAMHLSSRGVWVSLLSVTEWRSEGPWCPPRQQRRGEGTLLPFNGRQNLWLSCCTVLFMGTLCNKSLPVNLGMEFTQTHAH